MFNYLTAYGIPQAIEASFKDAVKAEGGKVICVLDHGMNGIDSHYEANPGYSSIVFTGALAEVQARFADEGNLMIHEVDVRTFVYEYKNLVWYGIRAMARRLEDDGLDEFCDQVARLVHR